MKQILVFVLFSALLCWLMFAPVYKHVVIMRQAVLQKEVDLLLEVGASGTYGYIDAALIEESKRRLAERGFDPDELIYTVTTTNGMSGTDPENPVPRGNGIRLTITYPYQNLFFIDRLIGLSGPAPQERLGAQGMKMSEYVPLE